MTGILNHAEFMDNPPIACWSIYRSSVAVDTNEPLLLSDLSFKCQGCVILKIRLIWKTEHSQFCYVAEASCCCIRLGEHLRCIQGCPHQHSFAVLAFFVFLHVINFFDTTVMLQPSPSDGLTWWTSAMQSCTTRLAM